MAGFHARGCYLFPLWPSQGGDKSPSLAMPHKFKVGQAVKYHPPRWIWAPPGTYLITAELPERNGEFEYHIRSVSEQNERMARESELTSIAVEGEAFRVQQD